VILAPMAGVTDLPFRRLVKRFGVGLVVSEMIASEAMVRANHKTLRMAAACHDQPPVSVQLAGCEPGVMAEAARLNVDRGAALIDINFGCPVKKVVSGEAGAALMRDEARAGRLLEAVVRAVSVPVTLKMRLGWDDTSRNAVEIARIGEAAGVQMVTVHGRTRSQFYRGQADWAAIAAVKQAVRIPVIANGDIVTCGDAARCLALSGADGVMIGRGSYGRPWFPAQVARFLAGRLTGAGEGTRAETLADPVPEEEPTPEFIGRAALEHFEAMLEHYGAEAGLRIARKHLSWYSKGQPGAAGFREEVNRLDRPAAVRERLAGFFRADHFTPDARREAA